jgi:hypothetical protein
MNIFWDAIKEGMIESIIIKLSGMYDSINEQIGSIAADVGRTPQAWNANIFTMIKSLSDTVIVPVAGMILTFILCYELIQVITERNNYHDFEVFTLYKWIFKTFIAVYILTHTFDIVIAVFELAQNVISGSAGLITGSIELSAAGIEAAMRTELEAMGVWELIGMWMELNILGLALRIMAVLIFVIIFGRMIEIYLTISIAPVPLATMANREWGQIGNHYLKSLFALAFQGFLIMVCVAIYAALVGTIPTAANAHAAVWTTMGYTALLSVCLLKTSNLAKSVFGA